MPNAKGSKALKQTAPSHSSLSALFSGIADPALKQDSRLDDLSNSDPDLCSTRKTVTYKDNADNKPIARSSRQHRLHCAFSSPKRSNSVLQTQNRMAIFRAGTLPLLCLMLLRPYSHC